MVTIHSKDTCSMCGNYLDDDLNCPECEICNPTMGGYLDDKGGEIFTGEYGIMKNDPVNNPKHYNRGNLECIEAIEAITEKMSGDIAPHAANVLKYLWRCEYKNGLQDIDKALWYLNRLKNRWIERDEVEKFRTGS